MSGSLNEDEVNKVFKEINETSVKNDLIDVSIIFRYIMRYKWLILAMTFAAITVSYAFTSLIRPVYESVTIFEVIQYNDSDVVGGGAFRNNFNFRNSQLSLLRGKRIATRVVEKLELYNNPEFTGELRQRTVTSIIKSAVRRGLSLVGLKNPVTDNTNDIVPVSVGLNRHDVVARLQNKLTVNLDNRSGLINVTVQSFNPQVSADIANAVVEVYRELDKQDKEAEKQRRSSTLEDALKDIQDRIGEQERKLAQFIRENNVVDLDDTDNLETQKLNLLNQQFLSAQSERISLESRYKFGSVENVVDFNELGNVERPSTNSASDEQSRQSNDVLQSEVGSSGSSLKNSRLELMTEIRNLKEIYKSDHPVLQEKQNQLAEIERNITLVMEERKKALFRQYQAAKDKEETLAKALEEQKELLLTIKENSLEYNILKRELQGLKQLHAGMLESVKKTGVASELQLTQVSVVDEARPNYGPVSPNIKQNVALAGLLGLLFSLGLAGFMGYYDRRLRTPDNLAQVSPYRNLSVVISLTPKELDKTGGAVELLSITDPGGGFAESFRSLRTSLMYSLPGGLPKAMMITSASPGEAKTTTIVNLAFTLQRNEGKRILLIDLDLRKPRLHKVFGLPVNNGVTDYVNGLIDEPVIYDVNELDSIKPYVQENTATSSSLQKQQSGLYLLTAGSLTNSPVELLEAEKFRELLNKLKEQFDVVLIDSAPVMGLSDALILSSFTDAVLLAVSAEKATRDSMRDTVKKLESVNARVVGTVMTKFNAEVEGYNYAGKYNAYYYDYGKS